MSPDRSVTAFAPATIGNVICGFDTFGLALESPGDQVTVRRASQTGLRISKIIGDGGRIPTDPALNSATVAISAMLAETGKTEGLEIVIEKGLPLSGGMGGSAASAVAAVVAADGLLGTGLPEEALLSHALAGERMAAGGGHLDNVAPALLGGLLLVRHSEAQPIVRLPIPEGLTVALLHPRVEMSTREGRQAIGDRGPARGPRWRSGEIPPPLFTLYMWEDWELLTDALEDRVAEPTPSWLDPGLRGRTASSPGRRRDRLWDLGGGTFDIFALSRHRRCRACRRCDCWPPIGLRRGPLRRCIVRPLPEQARVSSLLRKRALGEADSPPARLIKR